MSEQTNSAWGGRFSEATDAFVQRFTASVEFDQRMYAQDIQGSIAHATMLAKVGVLTDQERDDIIKGLGEDYQKCDYHITAKNCNHFSDQLCRTLVQRPAPRYINRLAGLGERLSCILPQELT